MLNWTSTAKFNAINQKLTNTIIVFTIIIIIIIIIKKIRHWAAGRERSVQSPQSHNTNI